MPDSSPESARTEAFSDGVFAIAITLLVLEIRVPHVEEDGQLGQALLDAWPAYAAYAISFATIGIMWLNHHMLFKLIRRPDHIFQILNLLLLMAITFVNFPTALVAEYILHPDARFATAVLSGTYVGIAIIYNALWRYAAYHRRLIREEVPQSKVDAITRDYRFGPLVYGLAFAASFVSALLSLAITLLLAIFFAVTGRSDDVVGES